MLTYSRRKFPETSGSTIHGLQNSRIFGQFRLGAQEWTHGGNCHLPLEKNFETLKKLLAPRSTP